MGELIKFPGRKRPATPTAVTPTPGESSPSAKGRPDIWGVIKLPLVMLFVTLLLAGSLLIQTSNTPTYLAPSDGRITWLEKSDFEFDGLIGPAPYTQYTFGHAMYGRLIAKHSQQILDKKNLLNHFDWKTPRLFKSSTNETPLSHIDSQWIHGWSTPAASHSSHSIIMTWTYDTMLADDVAGAGNFRLKSVADWSIPSGQGYLFTSTGKIIGRMTSDESTIELFGPAIDETTSDRRIWAVLQLDDLSAYEASPLEDKIKIPLPSIRLLSTGSTLSACNIQCKTGLTAIGLATLIGFVIAFFTVITCYRLLAKAIFSRPILNKIESVFVRPFLFTASRFNRLTRGHLLGSVFILGMFAAIAAASSAALPVDLPYFNFAYTSGETPLSQNNTAPHVITLERAALEMPCMLRLANSFGVLGLSRGFAELDERDANCLSNWSIEKKSGQRLSDTDIPENEIALSIEAPKVVLAGFEIDQNTLEILRKSRKPLKIGGGNFGHSSLMCLMGRCFGYLGKADMNKGLWPAHAVFPVLPAFSDSADTDGPIFIWLLHDLNWKTASSNAVARRYFESDPLGSSYQDFGVVYTWRDVVDRLPKIYVAENISQPQRHQDFSTYLMVTITILLVTFLTTVVFLKDRRFQKAVLTTDASNQQVVYREGA